MADYLKDTGNSGKMMIRDTGSIVEFWINSFNTTTYNLALPWGFTVNGVTSSRTARYNRGAGWVRLGAWTVSKTQTVTFRLGDTGTSGFGGPTTFSVAISRGSMPNPPSKPALTSVNYDSVFVTFTDGAANGYPIDQRQIGYGTRSTGLDLWVYSDKSTLITGLKIDTVYYFWARTHNALGWSRWSPYSFTRTLSGVTVYQQSGATVVKRNAIPWVNVNGVWRRTRPWARHLGTWKRVT